MEKQRCRTQYCKEYYLKNKDKIREKHKNHYAINKERIRAKQDKYYEKNRYAICHKKLNRYCFDSMEKIKSLCPDRIDEYTKQYPFEEYADRYIKRTLYLCRIFPNQSRYADCYDAGMVAYLYSIHRCAAMLYTHVAAYIKKMIRIYIICTINIHNDGKNLCEANNFKEIPINAEAYIGKY